jgi:hypothetical protein
VRGSHFHIKKAEGGSLLFTAESAPVADGITVRLLGAVTNL